MLARIRKAAEEKDSGFTLIELLVVMIIIGILAAIAIPVFLNQRKKAVDTSMKSDLRSVANEMETSFTDTQAYPTTVPVDVKFSKGNTAAVTISTDKSAYCVVMSRTAGSQPGTVANWVYLSNQGGIQDKATQDCSTLG